MGSRRDAEGQTVSVANLQVLHVAASSYQVDEAVVREPLPELGVYDKVTGAPRPFRRDDFSPHPRNAGKGEAVSGARDVREDRGGDTLADVKGAIVAGNVGLDLGDCSSRHDVGGRGSV